MRVLNHFGTRSLWACSHKSCFLQWFKWSLFANFGDLMGAAEPILIWHPSSLRRSLYCSYQSEAQTQLSYFSPTPAAFPKLHCLEYYHSQQNGAGPVLGASLSEDHWFFSVLVKCLWADQMLLGARSPPSSRTGLFFLISPLGWRDWRCFFWLQPVLTMIYVWGPVPGITLAPLPPPSWSCKSFPLMLVGMKGTELHLARKARS